MSLFPDRNSRRRRQESEAPFERGAGRGITRVMYIDTDWIRHPYPAVKRRRVSAYQRAYTEELVHPAFCTRGCVHRASLAGYRERFYNNPMVELRQLFSIRHSNKTTLFGGA